MHAAIGPRRHQALAPAAACLARQLARHEWRIHLQVLQAPPLAHILHKRAGVGQSSWGLKQHAGTARFAGPSKYGRGLHSMLSERHPAVQRGAVQPRLTAALHNSFSKGARTIITTEPSLDTAQNRPLRPNTQSEPMACAVR